MSNSEDVDERTALLPQENNRRSYKLTAELPIFAVLFTSALTSNVSYNLLLYRTCNIDLQYNTSECNVLRLANKTEAEKDIESKVQAATTVLVLVLSVIGGIVPAILSLFLGSWSDKHGRKPLIVWPLFGQIISFTLVVLFSAVPSLSAWWFVLCTIPYTVFGGGSTIALGANLLITDLSDEENRSLRLSILQTSGFIGILIGTVSSSYVYDLIGYVPMYSITLVIYIFTYVYTIFFIEESLTTSTRGTLKDLFDVTLVKDMVQTCFKKRTGTVTSIITLLLLAYSITQLNLNGIGNIDYLYTRQKFQWLLKQYSFLSAVNSSVIIFGLFFGMYFFKSVCKMSDGVLLMLSFLSFIADNVVMSFSTQSWHLYLAAVVAVLEGLPPPLMRSELTKVLPTEEIGKMYSLLSFIEAVLPIVAPFIFSTIYYATLTTFPGAAYALAAGLFTLCFCFSTISQILFMNTTPSGYVPVN